MKPIKVKFGRIKNVLLAQCLYMDESLRQKLEYSSEDGISISSVNSTGLDGIGNRLYLWGFARDKDDMIASYTYDTEEEAIKALCGFTKCVQEYNLTNCDNPVDLVEPKIHWTTVE